MGLFFIIGLAVFVIIFTARVITASLSIIKNQERQTSEDGSISDHSNNAGISTGVDDGERD